MSKTNITLIILGLVVVVALGAYLWLSGGTLFERTDTPQNQESEVDTEDDQTEDEGSAEQGDETQTVLGASAEGRDITAYHYGDGEREVLFVGGIHGGYNRNTTLLAYQLINYLEENPQEVPSSIRATIIPTLNPDGLYRTVGTTTDQFNPVSVTAQDAEAGRFSATGVDLNRNFDCNWQETGRWQSREVDAGDAPFSEPEARAFRDYVNANDIAGAVVYYSAAGGVYSSSCNGSPLTETTDLLNLYANASGYSAEGRFDAYEVTGDAVDWMAKMGIPGISVLLTTYDEVEWEENLRGIGAVLDYFATN